MPCRWDRGNTSPHAQSVNGIRAKRSPWFGPWTSTAYLAMASTIATWVAWASNVRKAGIVQVRRSNDHPIVEKVVIMLWRRRFCDDPHG